MHLGRAGPRLFDWVEGVCQTVLAVAVRVSDTCSSTALVSAHPSQVLAQQGQQAVRRAVSARAAMSWERTLELWRALRAPGAEEADPEEEDLFPVLM